MSRQIAMFIHVLAIGVQLANAFGALPLALGQYKPYIALVIGAGQALLGWLQHNFNPDGTPASVAYKPQ